MPPRKRTGRMSTGGKPPRQRILTPPPHNEPTANDMRRIHELQQRGYSPEWPMFQDTLAPESNKLAAMFRKPGAVAPTEEQLGLSAAKVPVTAPVGPKVLPRSPPVPNPSAGVIKPRPRPVGRRQKAIVTNEVVELTSTDEDNVVSLDMGDRMYSGTPKSKVHLANDTLATPIKTRSATGITKKREILDDPVESLLISKRSKKLKTTNVDAQPSIEESDDDSNPPFAILQHKKPLKSRTVVSDDDNVAEKDENLDEYDLADSFIDDSGIVADDEVSDILSEAEDAQEIEAAKKILKGKARAEPSELLETIETAEVIRAVEEEQDLEFAVRESLKAQRPVGQGTSSSDVSLDTTKESISNGNVGFAAAMKSMGLRLPVGNEGPHLQDVTGLRVKSLPVTCEVTNSALQDPLLAEDYAMLPPLKAGSLLTWSDAQGNGQVLVSAWAFQCPYLNFNFAMKALKFAKQGKYINPSRADPREIVVIPVRISTSERLHLYVGDQVAICVSPIFSVEDHLRDPSEVGLKQKYISGIFHSQEWERLCGFMCMAFQKEYLSAQLFKDALSFATKPAFQRNSGESGSGKAHGSMFSSVPSPSKKLPSSQNRRVATGLALECYDTIPVYDGRVKPLCFETDLGQLASVLEPYEGPIPYGSFVVVGYTAAVYRSSKDQSWTLACNVQWVIVLGTPDE